MENRVHEVSAADAKAAGCYGQVSEFDEFARQYSAMHAANIAVSGEAPEFFAEYKIADLASIARKQRVEAGRILDFGSGVGNSVPWFRK